MHLAELAAVCAHNVGNFQGRPHEGGSHLRLRNKDGIRKQIQWAGRGTDRVGGQTKVAGRGGQTAVTEEKLNFAQVGPGFQQMHSVGVS